MPNIPLGPQEQKPFPYTLAHPSSTDPLAKKSGFSVLAHPSTTDPLADCWGSGSAGPCVPTAAGADPHLTITPPLDTWEGPLVIEKTLTLPVRAAVQKHGVRCINRAANTLWSRVYMGMMLPGYYWFLTLTTSPKSHRNIRVSLSRFWTNWLKKKFPCDWLWCHTCEGLGVVHAVLRFDEGADIPTEDQIRQTWIRLHQAFIVDFNPVRDHDKTANYLLQRKNRTAQEFHHQPMIQKWHYSSAWLPRRYAGIYGRLWWRTLQFLPNDNERMRVTRDFMLAVRRDPDNLKTPPYLVEKKSGLFQIMEIYT
jgi:hypothetical protein